MTKGSCTEINDLVGIVRSWLDEVNLSVSELHARLTEEHFHDGVVPPLRRLRERLAGEGLTWDLVEAVADSCFRHEPQAATDRRTEPARALWEAAQSHPTVIAPDGGPAVPARELFLAQERALSALEELNRVRQAYEASERARNQSLQVATVLFNLLGQAQAQVAALTRRLDALNATPVPDVTDISSVRHRLGRATAQKGDLSLQLARAEAEREKAQGLADVAARRILVLEAELQDLRTTGNPGASPLSDTDIHLPQQFIARRTDEDSALDQVDEALQKARFVLDREHETVEDIADELGVRGTLSNPGPAPEDRGPNGYGAGHWNATDAGLFRTTPDNSPSRDEGPGTELILKRESDHDQLRFVGVATRRISRGIDLDEIVLSLCRASVPEFADAMLVYLRDPLPVGDERPVSPFVLRLRRSDLPQSGFPVLVEIHEVRSGGALAEVLRDVRPVFADSTLAHAALNDLLGGGPGMPGNRHVILAPLRGRRRVGGVAVFLRHSARPAYEFGDLLVAAQLATQTALGIDKAVLYGREAYIA
ncbi:hypothetical protein ACFU98_42745, partial [Streptomyces sp. NPDC057575]